MLDPKAVETALQRLIEEHKDELSELLAEECEADGSINTEDLQIRGARTDAPTRSSSGLIVTTMGPEEIYLRIQVQPRRCF